MKNSQRGMLLRMDLYTNIDLVIADVWITTAGTMCDDMARLVGEAVHDCMEQSGNADPKLVLMGFANLLDITDHDEISRQSFEFKPVRVVVYLSVLVVTLILVLVIATFVVGSLHTLVFVQLLNLSQVKSDAVLCSVTLQCTWKCE